MLQEHTKCMTKYTIYPKDVLDNNFLQLEKQGN